MSDDLISRQAAEMAFIEKGQHSRRYKCAAIWELNGLEFREVLDNLPSVQPKRETGQWIDTTVAFYRECWECGALVTTRMEKIFLHLEGKKLNYCPNCGAKMEV